MRAVLTPHPDTPCAAVARLEAEVERVGAGGLRLQYRLTGDLAGLVIPLPATSARMDELWKHTCFEAFVRAEGAKEYLEVNLAPSSAWAAYRFDAYRVGMSDAQLDAPQVTATAGEGAFELSVRLDLAGAPELRDAPVWRVGLSAVVETVGGARAYWAVAHPPGRPDFHHADGFALSVRASTGA